MTKNNIALGIAAIAVLLGLVAVNKPAQVQTETIVKEVPAQNDEFGAIPGTTIPGSKFSVGGIQQTYVKQGFVTATNTVCAIKSPGSTSTLVSAFARFNTSTSSASKVQFTNSSNLATSSNVLSTGLFSISANQSVVVQASTTPSGATIFSPNTYLTVGMYGATAGTVSPTGYCAAQFAE